MSTDLEAELLQAADDAAALADYFELPDTKAAMVARAVRLRQRAAWVRELEARLGDADASVFTERLAAEFRALTGPIPSPGTAPTERTP